VAVSQTSLQNIGTVGWRKFNDRAGGLQGAHHRYACPSHGRRALAVCFDVVTAAVQKLHNKYPVKGKFSCLYLRYFLPPQFYCPSSSWFFFWFLFLLQRQYRSLRFFHHLLRIFLPSPFTHQYLIVISTYPSCSSFFWFSFLSQRQYRSSSVSDRSTASRKESIAERHALRRPAMSLAHGRVSWSAVSFQAQPTILSSKTPNSHSWSTSNYQRI